MEMDQELGEIVHTEDTFNDTEVGVYKDHEGATIPTFGTFDSACFDLYACIGDRDVITKYTPYNKKIEHPAKGGKIRVEPGYRYLIPTGLIFDIPRGFSMEVFIRSGSALKHGYKLSNGTGIIDSDYINPLFLILENASDSLNVLEHGDRIAQAKIVRDIKSGFRELNTPPSDKTNRVGGFGSTGSN